MPANFGRRSNGRYDRIVTAKPGLWSDLFMTQRPSGGFTLIELIAVIVILGVLAMIAIPMFTDLRTDSRVAKMRNLAATMRSNAAAVRAARPVQGSSATTTFNRMTMSTPAGNRRATRCPTHRSLSVATTNEQSPSTRIGLIGC